MLKYFLNFFLKRKRSQLRKMMRGYRNLKKTGHIELINIIKREMTIRPFDIKNKKFSYNIFGNGIDSADLIIRQYLLVHLIDYRLNKVLLLTAGKKNSKVIYPLPTMWQDIVEKNGFKVSRFRSSILWYIFIFVYFVFGTFYIFKILFKSKFKSLEKNKSTKPYAYFFNLNQGNLPDQVQGEYSHDIISWYIKWKDRNSDIQEIRHNVSKSATIKKNNISIKFELNQLPLIEKYNNIFKYLSWAIATISITIIDLLRGNWWHALLLKEAALTVQARYAPKYRLGKEYYFNNSSHVYRPLWTYEVEKYGARIFFYFYSTHNETFKKDDGYRPLNYGWEAMNWPNYLVWNEYQENFIKRSGVKFGNIKIVGSIWFVGKSNILFNFPKKYIAVFDTTPFRSSFYCVLALTEDIYVPSAVNPFLTYTRDLIKSNNFAMVLKSKRDIGKKAHPHYRNLIIDLTYDKDVSLIDPEISAYDIIDNSSAVISFPFTSTALIAREMNKPSIYFDSTGTLQKNDRAAHGIEIISSKTALNTWILSL